MIYKVRIVCVNLHCENCEVTLQMKVAKLLCKYKLQIQNASVNFKFLFARVSLERIFTCFQFQMLFEILLYGCKLQIQICKIKIANYNL